MRAQCSSGRRGLRWQTGLTAAVLVVACGQPQMDCVTQLDYTEQAVQQQLLRRARLLSAGVPLRGDLAVDSTWTNSMGYRFICRTPRAPEGGLAAVRVVQHGVALHERSRHVRRAMPGHYRLRSGVRLLHVFAPQDEYVGSVAAPRGMGGREALEHLGVWRRVSARLSRMHLTGAALEMWRTQLPLLQRNDGYAAILLRVRPSRRNTPHGAAHDAVDGETARGTAGADSMDALVDRYVLEEQGDFLLVGRQQATDGYRHVFTTGERYLMTGIWAGAPPLPPDSLLSGLGLVRQGIDATRGGR